MNNKTKFDEFLDNDNLRYTTPDYVFLKIPYNEKLDTIFKTHFGQLDYSNKLDGVGIYDRENHKLYGASYLFDPDLPITLESRDVTSSYYIGTIEKLYKEMDKEIRDKLDDYIDYKKDYLVNLGYEENKKSGNGYQTIDGVNKDLEKLAKSSFVSGKNIVDDKYVSKYDIPIRQYDNGFNPSEVYSYLTNEDKFTKNYFDRLMNYERNDTPFVNYLARQVYRVNYVNNYLNEIYDNKDNQFDDLYKARDIMNAIKDKNYQTVNVTINKDNKEMSFKYSIHYFRVDTDLSLTHYGLVDAKERKLYEETFGDNWQNDFSLNDIKKITYGRNVIYEDSTMDKHKEIVSPKMEADILIEREEGLVYDKEDYEMEM